MANDEAVLRSGQTATAERTPERRRAGAMPQLRYLLRAMRPRQWTKNGIVFLAFIFSVGQQYHLSDPGEWLPKFGAAAVAAIAFILVSSADYLVNDIRDIESDRAHPKKRYRPIPAGLLPVRTAWTWAVILAVAGNGAAFALHWKVGLVTATYTLLIVLYSYRLKHVVLLDLMVISAGFVLRAMAGAFAIDVPISPWLYVVAALGALFLGINKRRAELELLEGGAGNHRKILDDYSVELLEQMGNTVTAALLMAYGLYTFTAEGLPTNHSMMLTIPFVLYGIFRYLYLVHEKREGGSPEDVLLRDVPIMVTSVGWILTAGIVLLVARQ